MSGNIDAFLKQIFVLASGNWIGSIGTLENSMWNNQIV